MKRLLTAGLATALLAGCATPYPNGALLYQAKLPVQSGDATISSAKTGKACATSLLSLVAQGDASIEAAKADGGITKVSSVDWDVKNYLGVYGEFCTIVRGE